MVLYFSATGNTRFIAEELARRLNDDCVDLLPRFKSGDHTPLHSDRPFIICAPVYVCEMPRFMSQYLKQQEFTGSRDVYFIFTSGGYCGCSGVPKPRSCALAAARDIHSALRPASLALSVMTSCQAFVESLQFLSN